MTENKDTIIVVGKTRSDEYGNLWVTPSGGGEEVKIAEKRKNLHSLFEQGKAVMCHWETYMNKPYVSDAKLVEGELPPPVKAKLPPNQEETVRRDLKDPRAKEIEHHVWVKELGECIRMWKEHPDTKPTHTVKGEEKEYPWVSVLIRYYFTEMLNVLNIKSEEGKED